MDVEHYDQLWKSIVKISKYASKKNAPQVTTALQNIFLKLSQNGQQEWFLGRFKTTIQSGDDEHIFSFASSFHLKVQITLKYNLIL